jgi:hypothetical protein
MTDEQLIAQQARRIAELEEELARRNEAEKKIHMEIYGEQHGTRLGCNTAGHRRTGRGTASL